MESKPDSGAAVRPALDVIVPVFRGEASTRACIESVLRSGGALAFELVVIDDCSPEPALSDWLRQQAADGRFRLLRNETNLGFVASVNRGMAEHPDRDVVLLNSDTEVPSGWLDRLNACAARDPRIATVTPFSNEATICSYPFEGWDGGLPGGLGLAELDRLFATVNAGRTVDLPTGIGFCLWIRRSALNSLGAFDEQAFGRGYGEESDFCMRAAAAGWRNVLAGDVFVYHAGSASFGSAERLERVRNAETVMAERHPSYAERVFEFIAADPLEPLRAAVDEARAARSIDAARAVLREQQRKAKQLLDRLAAARRLEALLNRCRADFAASQQALQAAEGFVREREREIEQLAQQQDQMVREHAERAARVTGLEVQLRDTKAHLDAILNSRSWRYTRALLRLIGRS
ncbi:MAG: glycosyltransferase [Burkholderiaceae bacterium]